MNGNVQIIGITAVEYTALHETLKIYNSIIPLTNLCTKMFCLIKLNRVDHIFIKTKLLEIIQINL